MAYTTIDDPSAYFQTALWTGDGSTPTITNDGNSDMQPDWLWGKNRTGTADLHYLIDSTRGTNKYMFSDSTSAEITNAAISSFNSDGFTLTSDVGLNRSGSTYVGWQWKANGGTTTSVSASGNGLDANTTKAGTYQANTTAGFSIVTFSTGSISNGDHRIEHGLGATPHFILAKSRDNAADWYTYHHKGTDDNDYLQLNTTNATSNAGARNVFDGSDFTSTYFEMDYNNILLQNDNFVAYCFTEIQGYSKFGSYTGNGSTDGAFIYTGFKPQWLMIKRTNDIGDWNIIDTTRDTINTGTNSYLYAHTSDAEQTGSAGFDILSNGFKNRNTHSRANASGSNYIYMCFASSPLVGSDGTPTTAR